MCCGKFFVTEDSSWCWVTAWEKIEYLVCQEYSIWNVFIVVSAESGKNVAAAAAGLWLSVVCLCYQTFAPFVNNFSCEVYCEVSLSETPPVKLTFCWMQGLDDCVLHWLKTILDNWWQSFLRSSFLIMFIEIELLWYNWWLNLAVRNICVRCEIVWLVGVRSCAAGQVISCVNTRPRCRQKLHKQGRDDAVRLGWYNCLAVLGEGNTSLALTISGSENQYLAWRKPLITKVCHFGQIPCYLLIAGRPLIPTLALLQIWSSGAAHTIYIFVIKPLSDQLIKLQQTLFHKLRGAERELGCSTHCVKIKNKLCITKTYFDDRDETPGFQA